MKILIGVLTYPPEIGGAAHLVHELAVRLQERDHEVTVLTGFPSYHIYDIPEKYRKGNRLDEEIDGVRVRRIRYVEVKPDNIIERGFQHFMIGAWLNALCAITKDIDVALIFSPPLPLAWMICLQGKLRRLPVVINIQDLFPREVIELGMLKNRLLIWLFERMERAVYRSASSVTVHSPGNKEHVLSHGGKPGKVDVVYNWVNVDQIHPRQRSNPFSQEYDLDKYFVVSYAGTMGWAQDMNTIVSCAQLLSNNPDILFLMVGEGVEKESAQEKCKELGLNNVLWLPIQPLSVYPDVLASSDVSMINLHPELRTPVVPSKLLSIMAAARPVVASLPKESDARLIITNAECGVIVDAGDCEALAKAILKLKEDKELADHMGRSGRAYVEANYSPDCIIEQIETILNSAIKE